MSAKNVSFFYGFPKIELVTNLQYFLLHRDMDIKSVATVFLSGWIILELYILIIL